MTRGGTEKGDTQAARRYRMRRSERSAEEDTHRNLNARIHTSRSKGPHTRPRREPEGPRRGITTIR